jgi:hypothetical protein
MHSIIELLSELKRTHHFYGDGGYLPATPVYDPDEPLTIGRLIDILETTLKNS